MKSFTVALASCVIAALARAQDPSAPAPAPAPAPAAPAPSAAEAAPAAAATPAFTEQQLIEEVGWVVAQKVGLTQLQFSDEETAALLKGFTAGLSGKDSPYNLQQAGPELEAFMQRKQAAYLAKMKTQSSSEAAAFFAKLQSDKDVVTTPSGLRYKIITPGDPVTPKPSETVQVLYTGTLVNGTVFDSSTQRGQPAEFPLDGVIPGWTEGIQKIGKGGKIKLYVPPELGYGDEGRPGIPPGSTLIFDVELIDIKPTPAAPAAGAAGAMPSAAPTPGAPPQG